MLVSVSTYTANLASFFTKANFKVHGPESSDELSAAIACSSTPGMSGSYAPYVGSVIEAPLRLQDLNASAVASEYCMDALRTGAADIWLADAMTLHTEHLQRCDETVEAAFVQVLPLSMAFALRSEDAHIARGLSGA